MKTLMSKKVSKIYSIVFISAIFILLFITALTYNQIKSMNDAQQLIIHTYKVKLTLAQLSNNLRNVETNQRGYIITGDSSYLITYHIYKIKTDSLVTSLLALTKDNKEQTEKLNKIRLLVKRRYEYLDETLILSNRAHYRSGISDSVKSNMLMGSNVMNLLKDEETNFISTENQLLIDRENTSKTKRIIAPLFIFLIVLFSLGVFVAAYFRIDKDVRKLTILNNDLRLKDISHSQAESVARLGNWQYDVNNDIFSVSDNYYSMIGAEKGEYDATIANYMISIHPDDLPYVEENAHRCLGGEEDFELRYRFYRKDTQELRHFRTVSRSVRNSNGIPVTLGINQDITDSVMNIQMLEKQNQELLNANYELSSFNYVASHDLQEPLRKIQMFISRITGDKDNQLSDKSLDFLKKTQDSANRMQILINDLLQYSRISRSEHHFESIHLNQIIADAWSNLAAMVEQKNAIIHADDLPDISGISFQISQLFFNLIGNSLKYTDGSRVPEIHISSTVVNGASIPFSSASADKNYLRISVLDNGIGFEQQYAQKIFTLFQRLHDKNTFSGTGIGLAICKKIIDNHNGFIEAKGYPGKGAEFILYFPII
ncbi:MAG TPA: CHASE3 domain-containing protein [Chitinophagales bacterium]|nr:CHASE3 domain-containing protein [Chitinophagales bacterium]